LKNKLRGLDKSSPVIKIKSKRAFSKPVGAARLLVNTPQLKKIMLRNQKNSHLRIRKTCFPTGIVWVVVYFTPLAKEVFREDSKIRLDR